MRVHRGAALNLIDVAVLKPRDHVVTISNMTVFGKAATMVLAEVRNISRSKVLATIEGSFLDAETA